jgi:hypothetical protein
MATPLTPEDSGGKKPAPRKARSVKDSSAKSESNGRPAPTPETTGATKTRRLPAATIRALKQLESGKLNRYADEDELFAKLDIKLGQE